MGTSLRRKKYVIISGFNINDNNRGTAALGYGAISFLSQHGYLNDEHTLLKISFYKNPFKRNTGSCEEKFCIDGKTWKRETYRVFFGEKFLLLKWKIRIPFSGFKKRLEQIEYVAAINGGDGFSDIYNTATFMSRLGDINISMAANIPLIFLPQTLGPFKQKENLNIATKILQYAKAVYVRDGKFVEELGKMGVEYRQVKDLSYYMKPQSWNINIIPNSIGINVSGLAYSNQFRSLAGQFEQYPILINKIITRFINMGHSVYLIPHSYNYAMPEINNDDMLACRAVYERVEKKEKVILIDKDMTSPQVKYVISQMSFFIGTRMHANFAAIYTNVPVFGLAYSYKFKEGFDNNGLDGEMQTAEINNITCEDTDGIVEKIVNFFRLQRGS